MGDDEFADEYQRLQSNEENTMSETIDINDEKLSYVCAVVLVTTVVDNLPERLREEAYGHAPSMLSAFRDQAEETREDVFDSIEDFDPDALDAFAGSVITIMSSCKDLNQALASVSQYSRKQLESFTDYDFKSMSPNTAKLFGDTLTELAGLKSFLPNNLTKDMVPVNESASDEQGSSEQASSEEQDKGKSKKSWKKRIKEGVKVQGARNRNKPDLDQIERVVPKEGETILEALTGQRSLRGAVLARQFGR